jgi:hypothetical protein
MCRLHPPCVLCRDHKTGMLKGDALIVFLLRPSVNLAIKVMHGRPFRPGSGTAMTVQEASFQPRLQDGQHDKITNAPEKPKNGPKAAGTGAGNDIDAPNCMPHLGVTPLIPHSKRTVCCTAASNKIHANCMERASCRLTIFGPADASARTQLGPIC